MSASPATCIVARLLASTAVAALIGDRLEPAISSEQTVLPRVVYTVISTDPQLHMGGGSGLTFDRIQFDAFAEAIEEAEAIAEAFRNRLHGFRGNITVDGVARWFGLIKLESAHDAPVDPTDGSDQPTHRKILDYFFSCEESIPALNA